MILDEEIEIQARTEDYAAYLSEIISSLRMEFPEAFKKFAEYVKRCRWPVGYDNICRLILGETPEQIKIFGRYTKYMNGEA